MRRRDFIALAGGMAAWPLAARAQQDNRVRHIGVFMNLPEGDPDGTHWIAALLKSLDEFGWTEGRNIRLDFRWGVDAEHVRKNAEELVALNPDVIVAASAPAVLALQQATRKVPIIFVAVTDPVPAGFEPVESWFATTARDLVVYLKRNGDPHLILNQLYEYSPLQKTVSIILLALVDGQPRSLNIREMLQYYLRHRVQVIRRRTEFLVRRGAWSGLGRSYHLFPQTCAISWSLCYC